MNTKEAYANYLTQSTETYEVRFICKFYWVLLKLFFNFQFINFALYVSIHRVHIVSDPHCVSLPFGSFIIYNLMYPVAYSHTICWIACWVCILIDAISNPFCAIHMLSAVPRRNQFCELVISWGMSL
jgi:hypothetical protein